ncbi:hypothetical protein QE177_14880 (plasmid) [Arsenophonus sp. aPb]|uniref:hypothetical protein n=1 Tax=Arsenophonus sp. aPb TaxID=3041619 RepID=UPI00246969C8|nr:hypothetical protein [Arsenophonus sp. aPb]WGL99868.1 hypothetical protein QE177_14880 [Arsenophonus sp. aPb]
MGEKYSVYFKLSDNIFKTDDFFEINITSSTGKNYKFSSVYDDESNEPRYNQIDIDNSAGTIILDFVIQRKDNYEVISTCNATIKYDDIIGKLSVFHFESKPREGVSIKLDVVGDKNDHATLEITRKE